MSSKVLKKTLCCFVVLSVFWMSVDNGQAAELALGILPQPGTMLSLSKPFHPTMLKGVLIHPENPFEMDFIVDEGERPGPSDVSLSWPTGQGHLTSDDFKSEANKLIRYFLASLTVPENDLWVNLSPYEKDRIIPDAFGMTEMGRDLLGQDYVLKQLTSSLIYPEKELGKKFWDEVYKRAFEKFGTTDIPVDTFNKVWIVPEKAIVYERAADSRQQTVDRSAVAYVVEAKLKVMLESDYLAASKQGAGGREQGELNHEATAATTPSSLLPASSSQELAKQVLREVIIPILEKEVNEGANFATLRQIFHAMILAAWFKVSLKNSILGQVYADQNKVKGVDLAEPQAKQKIYEQYLAAFKKGVFNYIKEEYDPLSQETLPRKYFSGGFDPAQLNEMVAKGLIHTVDAITFASTVAGRVRDVEVRLTTDLAKTAPSPEALRIDRQRGNSDRAMAGLIQALAPMRPARIIERNLQSWLVDFTGVPEELRPLIAAAKGKVADYLRDHGRIPHESFIDGLNLAVKQFNGIIEQSGPYAVFFDEAPLKSSHWVYDHVKNMGLSRRPYFGAFWTSERQGQYAIEKIIAKGVHTFVIFDDVIYSGQQVEQKIDYILSHSAGAAQKPQFIVVTSFSTRAGDKRLKDRFDSQVTLVHSGDYLQTWGDLLTEQEVQAMSRVYPGFHPDQVLNFFDHKKADVLSMGPDIPGLISVAPAPYGRNTFYFNRESKEYGDFLINGIIDYREAENPDRAMSAQDMLARARKLSDHLENVSGKNLVEITVPNLVDAQFEALVKEKVSAAVEQSQVMLIDLKQLGSYQYDRLAPFLAVGSLLGSAVERELSQQNPAVLEAETVSAVQELLKNALYHGNRMDWDLPILLWIDKDKQKITVYDVASTMPIDPVMEEEASRDRRIHSAGVGLDYIKLFWDFSSDPEPQELHSPAGELLGTEVSIQLKDFAMRADKNMAAIMERASELYSSAKDELDFSREMDRLAEENGWFHMNGFGDIVAKDGSAYVLTGDPMSGKTKMSFALTRLGFNFVSSDGMEMLRSADGSRVIAGPRFLNVGSPMVYRSGRSLDKKDVIKKKLRVQPKFLPVRGAVFLVVKTKVKEGIDNYSSFYELRNALLPGFSSSDHLVTQFGLDFKPGLILQLSLLRNSSARDFFVKAKAINKQVEELQKRSDRAMRGVESLRPADIPRPRGTVTIDVEGFLRDELPRALAKVPEGNRALVESAFHKTAAYLRQYGRISQEHFEDKLAAVVDRLNKILPAEHPYAAILGEEAGHSERWVLALAWSKLIQKPKYGVYPNIFDNSIAHTIKKLNGEGIYTYVFFDDAIYSGVQMVEFKIKSIIAEHRKAGISLPKMIVAVPFMTRQAQAKLRELDADIVILSSQEIPVWEELLTSEEQAALRQAGLENVLKKAVNVFDHKISADGWSLPDEIIFHVETSTNGANYFSPYSPQALTEYSFMEKWGDFQEYRTEGLVTYVDHAQLETPGGIDLRNQGLGLEIKRDENGNLLPLTPEQLEKFKIDGLAPVIINITPVEDLPMLLGQKEEPSGTPVGQTDGSHSGQGLSFQSLDVRRWMMACSG